MARTRMVAAALSLVCACGTDDAEMLVNGGETTAPGLSESGSTDTSTSGLQTSAEDDASSSGGFELPPAPTSIAETLAIYGEAWGEPDPARRGALLGLAWADAGVYRDPMVLAEGRDALVDAIGEFQQGLPGAMLELSSDVDTYGSFVRFDWALSGPIDLPGMDFGEVDEDLRLVRIVGFFGPMPTDTPVPDAVQTYLDAWNESDPATRASLLAQAVTEDVVYRDPNVEVTGIEALSEYIGGTHKALGGAQVALQGTPDAHGPMMRFAWRIGDPPVAAGLDVVTVADDGRLAEVNGFFAEG